MLWKTFSMDDLQQQKLVRGTIFLPELFEDMYSKYEVLMYVAENSYCTIQVTGLSRDGKYEKKKNEY